MHVTADIMHMHKIAYLPLVSDIEEHLINVINFKMLK